jgi:hypothetical protein
MSVPKDQIWTAILFCLEQISKIITLWERLKGSKLDRLGKKIIDLSLLVRRLVPALWATCAVFIFLGPEHIIKQVPDKLTLPFVTPLMVAALLLGPAGFLGPPLLIIVAYLLSYKAVKQHLGEKL